MKSLKQVNNFPDFCRTIHFFRGFSKSSKSCSFGNFCPKELILKLTPFDFIKFCTLKHALIILHK